MTTVRGTESVIGARDGIRAPHGMPVDLLDRLMIIKTAMYSSAELKEIAKLRAKAEGVDLTPNGLDKLGEVNISRVFVGYIHIFRLDQIHHFDIRVNC